MPSPGSTRGATVAARPLSGGLRVVRGGVLGGFSLLLATVAHLLGGGVLPPAGVLVVTAVLLGLAAAVLTARRCRFGLLLAVLTVQQGLLHELFEVAGAARSCVTHLAGGAHLHLAEPVTTACTAAAGMSMTSALPGWAMTAAHLLATALTAGLLARGEAWLWRVVDRVAVAAGLRAESATHLRPGRRTTVTARAAAPRPGTWRPAGPRGPPALPAV